MRHFAGKITVAMLGLALVAVPLTGCGGAGGGEGTAEDTTESVATERKAEGSSDYTTWKTLGDAFAATSQDPEYGYDDSCYIGIIRTADNKTVYVAAQMTPDAFKDASNVDVLEADAVTKMEDALSSLPIGFKEDITDKKVDTTTLESFVGKTGQDLVDAGFTFESYFMYDGPETMATYANGYYGYNFTFDATVPEASTGDGGASVLSATIKSVDTNGTNLSNFVLDSAHITEITGGAVTGTDPSVADEASAGDGATDATPAEEPPANDASASASTTPVQ